VVGQRNGCDKCTEAAATSTEEQRHQSLNANPEAQRSGLWGDEKFLENVGGSESKTIEDHAIADFHGQAGFPAVFNHDRKGSWLDKDGKQIGVDDPDRSAKRFTLRTSILKGMQCNDCHFAQENHGNGKIYGQPACRGRKSICVDCPRHDSKESRARNVGPRLRKAAAISMRSGLPGDAPIDGAMENISALDVRRGQGVEIVQNDRQHTLATFISARNHSARS